jgi:hypothetical protein
MVMYRIYPKLNDCHTSDKGLAAGHTRGAGLDDKISHPSSGIDDWIAPENDDRRCCCARGANVSISLEKTHVVSTTWVAMIFFVNFICHNHTCITSAL